MTIGNGMIPHRYCYYVTAIHRHSLQEEFYIHSIPYHSGTTSWEQYGQVFDAIVLSSGWDDATSALQLLSHLEGDALNVALLVPMYVSSDIENRTNRCIVGPLWVAG